MMGVQHCQLDLRLGHRAEVHQIAIEVLVARRSHFASAVGHRRYSQSSLFYLEIVLESAIGQLVLCNSNRLYKPSSRYSRSVAPLWCLALRPGCSSSGYRPLLVPLVSESVPDCQTAGQSNLEPHAFCASSLSEVAKVEMFEGV